MTITIITRHDCENCATLRAGLRALHAPHTTLDAHNPEGLALLAYHDALGFPLPVMVVDGVMVRGWRTWLARRGTCPRPRWLPGEGE